MCVCVCVCWCVEEYGYYRGFEYNAHGPLYVTSCMLCSCQGPGILYSCACVDTHARTCVCACDSLEISREGIQPSNQTQFVADWNSLSLSVLKRGFDFKEPIPGSIYRGRVDHINDT